MKFTAPPRQSQGHGSPSGAMNCRRKKQLVRRAPGKVQENSASPSPGSTSFVCVPKPGMPTCLRFWFTTPSGLSIHGPSGRMLIFVFPGPQVSDGSRRYRTFTVATSPGYWTVGASPATQSALFLNVTVFGRIG